MPSTRHDNPPHPCPPGHQDARAALPPPTPREWAARVALVASATFAGIWVHSTLWPAAAAGNVVAFAAAVGLCSFASTEFARAARAAADRRAASRISAHNERLVRTFFEHTPTAVAMLDRDMRYIVHSRAWTREYGLGDASLVGRSHYDVFPGLPAHWREIHLRCLAGAIERCDEDEFVAPDGARHHLRWDCRPWYDADGSIGGLTFMTQDTTASKRVETERLEHNHQLLKATEALTLQAQALSHAMEEAQAANRAKTEFLANISHEIRTPLTAILGYSQFLKEPGLADAERNDAVDRLAAAGTHLASLLDDVLDLTKIEAGHMAVESIPTDVPGVLRETAAMLAARAAEKGLELIVEIDPEAPTWTCTDSTRLRQILVNLVSNAVKFTPSGSVVVRLHAPDAGSIAIEVADTGIGIDAADMGRLFQPFSQADGSTARRFGGTGLGLRISHKLAALMNGTIVVASRVGSGSTFTLRLPHVVPGSAQETSPLAPPTPIPAPGVSSDLHGPAAATPSALAAAVASHATSVPLPPTAAGPLSGRTVLIVDDSPDNLRLAAAHLRRAGASVICAECGAAALAADAPAPRGAFDLVLLDLHMPDVDGYATLDLMRSHGLRAPIVAFTAHSSTTERRRALNAGFDGFITKPFTPVAIVEVCQSALRVPPRRAA